MASLYLAHRTGPAGFARPVALKVIHPHLSQDAQFVRMFLDEALLCARIRHPNVVHVEELGQHAGAYYLAMEYVEGCSLEDVLDRLGSEGELMDPRIAVSIASAVLEGLHATHSLTGDHGEALEVVHRDVSPSNILIDRTGHVTLIDFGIAKARGRAVETSAGTLKGKYAYMSPEQAWGREVDLRTDLYALSVVLWEMLATRPLFSADTELGLLELARASNIPRLTPFLPSIPEGLDKALAWGLSADREARPSSARALRKALLDAMPEARETDDSELAQLVARVSVAPSRPPGLTVPSGALGPTLASTPTGAAGDAQLSAPAPNTNVGRSRSMRRALTVGFASIALAALAALLIQQFSLSASRSERLGGLRLCQPCPKLPRPNRATESLRPHQSRRASRPRSPHRLRAAAAASHVRRPPNPTSRLSLMACRSWISQVFELRPQAPA
jgi:eukaryotic-like serine/threonine-protein kinase